MNAHVNIGIFDYPNAQKSSIYGIADLFVFCENVIKNNAKYAGNTFEVNRWIWDSQQNQPVCVTDPAQTDKHTPSVMIIPPSLHEPMSAEDAARYTPWLLTLHNEGCLLASACAGAFLLAETGLLDNRKATTHWNYCAAFTRRFPHVLLDTDKLFIDEGSVITSGGALSWTDLGLRLIDRFLGAEVMLDTARMLVIDPPGREQSMYAMFIPNTKHGDAPILRVQQWLADHFNHPLSQNALAERAMLEPRTFLRRFKKATGHTPTEYYQRLRISHGRHLLETTRLPIETIAWKVGYGDHTAFRKLFVRYVGLSPGDYRQKFHA